MVHQQDFLVKRERELQQTRKEMGDYEGAERVLAAHTQAEKNLALVDEHIAGVEKDILEVKASIAENTTTEGQPDTTAIDAQITDLDERIRKGNAALTEAIEADMRIKARAEALDTKARLDAKQALLENLVDYLDPRVYRPTLDEHVRGFEGNMNKVLATWVTPAHLQFEPFQFSLSFAGKDRVYNLRTISKSQKHAFSIAFQVALAKVSGFNFVVVDECDLFLDANRAQMYTSAHGCRARPGDRASVGPTPGDTQGCK